MPSPGSTTNSSFPALINMPVAMFGIEQKILIEKSSFC
jgi:hypothetical protein